MAIRPCKECGNPVSDKAEACPKCGAKQEKKMSIVLKILLWLFGISILVSVIGGMNSKNNKIEDDPKIEAQPTQNENNTSKSNWFYHESKDELHSTTTKLAVAESLNSANFGFPYGNSSKLLLGVRKNHQGLDVYITIDKGQFVCGIVDGCDVAFKFDDGNIMNITMVEPDSHAADVLFVKLDSTESKIVEKIKTSKKLIIAPKFYQHGDVQFVFNVENYKPI